MYHDKQFETILVFQRLFGSFSEGVPSVKSVLAETCYLCRSSGPLCHVPSARNVEMFTLVTGEVKYRFDQTAHDMYSTESCSPKRKEHGHVAALVPGELCPLASLRARP